MPAGIEPIERAVLEVLAALVKSSTPAEVAKRAGMGSTHVRAVLRRLQVCTPALVEYDIQLARWRMTDAAYGALSRPLHAQEPAADRRAA